MYDEAVCSPYLPLRVSARARMQVRVHYDDAGCVCNNVKRGQESLCGECCNFCRSRHTSVLTHRMSGGRTILFA
jgi:hypothetical protein